MFNHYCEALKIIKANTAELAVVNGQLGLCTADYHRFLDEERKYLHGLKKEPEEDGCQPRHLRGHSFKTMLQLIIFPIRGEPLNLRAESGA